MATQAVFRRIKFYLLHTYRHEHKLVFLLDITYKVANVTNVYDLVVSPKRIFIKWYIKRLFAFNPNCAKLRIVHSFDYALYTI